ncbi:MAG TPA: MarR family transcriptional regulator [Cytophagales bacterium]|nr:MarR family transcriptional regulator [Cytophagales bacterium]HAA18472.1 MarR family transcriptional regulator [Cytophagales bacterium]HAP61502.1 MarR family transcriptional regulator [Cytophagales bacterium]
MGELLITVNVTIVHTSVVQNMIDTQLYYQTVHEIIKTGHWITDQVGIQLKEYDTTEPQYNVLRILHEQAGTPISVQDIQQQMVQRSSNVTRIIDKLLAKALVHRQECATNRRKMDITITEAGEQLLQKLDKKVYELHAPMQGNLTPAEIQQLKQLINKLMKGA